MDRQNLIIWGCGYLGFSNLVFFGRTGFYCTGVDILPDIEMQVLAGTYKKDLQNWLNVPYQDLFQTGRIKILNDWRRIQCIHGCVHIICVPTEANGEPEVDTLFEIIEQIIVLQQGLSDTRVLIESTLPYGTADRILERLNSALNHEILFCVSPRRDWFTENGQNLRTLTRVYGCNSNKADELFRELLSHVCESLVLADDYRYAELTKSVENSIRHLNIIYANQLSDAFPELNIRKVLALAGTKWNINTYFPSFGPGGYCIPLSSKYVVNAALPRRLSLLDEGIRYMEERPRQIAHHIKHLLPLCSKILVLGVAYMAGVCVDKESPIIPIIRQLRKDGYILTIHDPLFSHEHLEQITGCEAIEDERLSSSIFWKQFNAVILNTDHNEYSELPARTYFCLGHDSQIFDNTGAWQCHEKILTEKNITYRLIGTKSWQAL